jgi:uncharacterized membrane protein YcaP (DUF421 family)
VQPPPLDSTLGAEGLLVLFRLTGRRSLRETTPFDLVLLPIMGEATRHALPGEDVSIVKAVVVITTLLPIGIGLSLVRQRSALAEAARGRWPPAGCPEVGRVKPCRYPCPPR